MTAQAYVDEVGKFGIRRHDGNQEFTVVGTSTAFYVYLSKGMRGKSSGWVRGDANRFHRLRQLFDARKKRRFIEEVEQIGKELR